MAKKDLALLILSKKKPDMEDKVKSEEIVTDSEESKEEMAAEEILAAIKAEDTKELGTLLKDFVSMCRSSKEKNSEEEDSMEESGD